MSEPDGNRCKKCGMVARACGCPEWWAEGEKPAPVTATEDDKIKARDILALRIGWHHGEECVETLATEIAKIRKGTK